MNAPYTTRTGLRIGCKLDTQPQQPHHDSDALRLQDALLGCARRTDWDGIVIVLGTLAAIAAIAWWTA